jgi:cobalt-zinc-cadmium efflux system protein
LAHHHHHERGHGHGQGHGRGSSFRRLTITLALVLVYMVAEVVGGLLANSLALLADAGHMLSDAASLGLALFAIWAAQRPKTASHTYGFHRAEILAALVNGVTLVVIALFILREAWGRIQNPPEVQGPLMMAVAAGGLLVNLAGMWILHGGRSESLNLRGAWLHVVADALGSFQAVMAGFLIWSFGWDWADPLASLLIAALVVWSSWSLLRDSVNVLLEGTPPHIDPRKVEEAIVGVQGIVEVHDLHIWTITSGFESLSVHVRVEPRHRDQILSEVRRVLREDFGIEHSTVQVETPEDLVQLGGQGPCAGPGESQG